MNEQFNDNPVILHSIYRKAAISFFVFTAVLLLLVAYLVLPKAIIVITPDVVKVEYSYVFTVAPEGNAPAAADTLSGTFLTTEIRQDKTFPVSGLETGYKKVTGQVRLTNNYSKDQPLVATTRLQNEEGKLFRLKEGVIVPAGGEEVAEIYAADSEAVFNPQAISNHLIIPGLWDGLQDKIYGTLEGEISGEAVEIKLITEDDLAKAKEILRTNTEDIGGNILKQKLVNLQDFNPAQSSEWVLATVKIISESWEETPLNDSFDSGQFQLSGQFILAGIFYDPLEAKEKIDAKVRTKITDNEKIISDEKGLKVELLDSDGEGKTGQVYISFMGNSIFNDVNKLVAESALVGLNATEAMSYLANLDGVAKAQVELTPWWVKRVPKNNIDIVVLQP